MPGLWKNSHEEDRTNGITPEERKQIQANADEIAKQVAERKRQSKRERGLWPFRPEIKESKAFKTGTTPPPRRRRGLWGN
jgi:hypothetical protein